MSLRRSVTKPTSSTRMVDVIDSGVFERTYFDETLENDDDDYDHNADIEDFYGSKTQFVVQ